MRQRLRRRRAQQGGQQTRRHDELIGRPPVDTGTPESENGHYGIFESGLPCQSALMPTNFTTLPHFSVSSAMSVPKSAGEPTSGVPPRSASRALILGSASAALISLLSLSITSAGVRFGAPIP